MVRIDSASVEIPKINLTGTLAPYTRAASQDEFGHVLPGTTIPGLLVRNDGFRLGEAKLTFGGELNFGSLMKLKGLGAGVIDFGVTFGQSIDFDGAVFIAANEATLFPGKKFELSLRDGTDADS